MRIAPTSQSKEFQKALERVIGNEGKDLDSTIILAVTANLVGRLIAMQDQRAVDREKAIQIVLKNIEIGNAEAHNTAGHAVFLKYRDPVTGLHQRSCAGYSGHTCTDDGDVSGCCHARILQ